MKKKLFFAVLLTISLGFNACSTVLNTTTQEVMLKTEPGNAKIIIDGKKFGTTPQTVNIERGSNHVIKFELEGYDSYEIQITRKVSFWFWANVLNGILPGMLVDMFTGSMYNLMPSTVDIELKEATKVEKPAKK